jgi:hypothetical protein
MLRARSRLAGTAPTRSPREAFLKTSGRRCTLAELFELAGEDEDTGDNWGPRTAADVPADPGMVPGPTPTPWNMAGPPAMHTIGPRG